jgi:phytoene desaturase
MAEVVVVGGGVGGLAAAMRLGSAGHHVTVLERNDVMGGKLAMRQRNGFSFETGPSLLTMPAVFDELFALGGSSLAEAVDLVRLDPICRYRFADGSTFDTRACAGDTEAGVETFSPGSGQAWRTFHERGLTSWDVAERTFFAGPMGSPVDMARRLRSVSDLTRIDATRTLHRGAERAFTHDPRLVQYVDRYATYSGSSPYRTPATLACIPAIEQHYGAWYVRGGLGRLSEALASAAESLGASLRTRSDVTSVLSRDGRVTGVRLADGQSLSADIVVADVDAQHLYADLVPNRTRLRRLSRVGRSSSGFVLLAGVRGRTEGLAHHNVSFPESYCAEFDALFTTRRPVADPAVYVCCSSVTDHDQAPDGCENWFVLVNAPAGGTTDWSSEAPQYRDHLLEVMAARGWDLSGRLQFVETITPADIARRYRTHQGAIYGTSSNGRAAAFLRPGNRGPLDGLYLVGGSSHPGGGLPLVAISARIVADLIDRDRR